ncbi:MAG: type II glyceraldehyde-3-phosphate dehydrogenase [Nanoarchaeota archaeon]
MAKIKVSVNGYGNIGKRVAEAVRKQKDMELVGVSKVNPDYHAQDAVKKGVPLFSINSPDGFHEKNIELAGSVDDMLKNSDVVVDCAPSGVGNQNASLYARHPHLKIAYQGGEAANTAPISFNAQANYEKAIGKKTVRVVSCNTTALSRIIKSLDDAFGVQKARVAIVRRAADPNDASKFTLNSVTPTSVYPSHHALDLNTVLPHIRITTMSCVAPTTLMHVHMFFATLRNPPTQVSDIFRVFGKNKRLLIVSAKHGLFSTGQIKDLAYENGRQFGDLYETGVWKEVTGLDSDGELGMSLAIDQQAVTIPETIDAIRAMTGIADKETSMDLTNNSLGIGELDLKTLMPSIQQKLH